LYPGQSEEFKISTATLADLALGTLTNVATVTSDEGLTVETAETVPVVKGDVALSVVKVGPTRVVEVGEAFEWTITVTNRSAEDLDVPVTLTDALPAGLAFESIDAADDLWCTEVSGVVTCSVDSLAAGTSASLTIATSSRVYGEVTNVVSVDARGVTEVRAITAAAAVQVNTPEGATSPLAFTGRSIAVPLLVSWLLISFGVVLIHMSRREDLEHPAEKQLSRRT